MAHYAEIDKEGKVLRVIVVNNSDCIYPSVKESYPTLKVQSLSGTKVEVGLSKELVEWEDEKVGIDFCKNLLGGEWIKTSYNGNIRKQYAGIGYTYDRENDVFISPSPYLSWKLDRNFDWQAPVEKPVLKEGEFVEWNEKELKWNIVLMKGIK